MPIEEDRFAGGVAVVTGAGSGIGMGFARRLAAIGMRVVVADVVEPRAESVAGDIRDEGGLAEAMTVDVAQPAELDRLAETVFARHGAVRLLVNNAAIETLGLSWEIPADRWERTLDINIHGVIHGVRAFVPRMIAAGQEAWIANVASVGAFGTMPTQTAYILSKHAIQSFSECLYLEMELAGAPIHVSSVLPGAIRTRIFDDDGGEGEPATGARYRAVMRERSHASTISMTPDEGAALFVRQIAENRFWVESHPAMTAAILDRRLDFLRERLNPTLPPEAASILDI